MATGDNFMDYSDCATKFTPGQSERMWAKYNEFRRRVEPCGGAVVRFEVQLDDKPQDIDVGYRSSGSAGIGSLITLMPQWELETHVNFTHQLLSREVCVERNDINEVFVFDMLQDGMSAPGYVAVFLNERQVFRQSTFNEETRFNMFVAGDSLCDINHERMTLDIVFGFQDLQEVSWVVYNSNDAIVVDSTATTALGRGTYTNRLFNGRSLFFDQCLPPDLYRFRLSVTPGGNVSDYVQYYRLALGDMEIYNGTMGNDILFGEPLESNVPSLVPSGSPTTSPPSPEPSASPSNSPSSVPSGSPTTGSGSFSRSVTVAISLLFVGVCCTIPHLQ